MAVDELRSANPRAELVVDANQPLSGTWDPDRLAQVASNLIGNAVVHGTGRVDVRVARRGDEAILEVHNAGPSIPADVVPRIFEAFERPATGMSARGAGLGLGLFIAERIVAAHGGKIEVHSTAAEGTTFLVALPASAPQPMQSPAVDANPASTRFAVG